MYLLSTAKMQTEYIHQNVYDKPDNIRLSDTVLFICLLLTEMVIVECLSQGSHIVGSYTALSVSVLIVSSCKGVVKW